MTSSSNSNSSMTTHKSINLPKVQLLNSTNNLHPNTIIISMIKQSKHPSNSKSWYSLRQGTFMRLPMGNLRIPQIKFKGSLNKSTLFTKPLK